MNLSNDFFGIIDDYCAMSNYYDEDNKINIVFTMNINNDIIENIKYYTTTNDLNYNLVCQKICELVINKNFSYALSLEISDVIDNLNINIPDKNIKFNSSIQSLRNALAYHIFYQNLLQNGLVTSKSDFEEKYILKHNDPDHKCQCEHKHH